MKVLLVKTSSMGDVIHVLPALSDAKKYYPQLQFDWIVEPAFAEIPRWHEAVRKVIVAPLRRWRKSPWQAFKQKEWQHFIKELRQEKYDAVIDAQGLVKSALVSMLAKGPRFGLDFKSARGKLISLSYHRRIFASKNQHAVSKNRELFAKIFNYPLVHTAPDYGIRYERLPHLHLGEKTIVFLHGTTWPTKHWPEKYWQQLALIAASQGYQVLLPWGNEAEHVRAQEIWHFVKNKGAVTLPQVLPKLTLAQLGGVIAHAVGIVAVDTGLGHMAAAMAVPTLSLYGPTDPDLTGAYGPGQQHLAVTAPCAPCFGRTCKKAQLHEVMPPCFASLPPEKVWQALMALMTGSQSTQPRREGVCTEQHG